MASPTEDWLDGIPIWSQIKSAALAAVGDMEGARETQVNFTRMCPLVSQIRSAVELGAYGDKEAATNTHQTFVRTTTAMFVDRAAAARVRRDASRGA
jgi:hypothetical protein